MTYEQINALLDKYWEAETSLEEERVLKAYFASGPIDERLQAVAPMFQALRTDQAIEYSKAQPAALQPRRLRWHDWAIAASFAAFLMAGAWWYFRPVPPAQEIVQRTEQPAVPALPPVAVPPLPVVDAPVEPVLVTVKPKLNQKPPRRKIQPDSPSPQDSYDDPEKAIAEIKAALELVSSKLNKGKKEAAKNLDRIENVEKIFKKKKESDG